MKPFPFEEAMQFGFGVLRLNSKDFWAMSPLELAAAYRAFMPQQNAPIDRNSFNDLMDKYPDRKNDNE